MFSTSITMPTVLEILSALMCGHHVIVSLPQPEWLQFTKVFNTIAEQHDQTVDLTTADDQAMFDMAVATGAQLVLVTPHTAHTLRIDAPSWTRYGVSRPAPRSTQGNAAGGHTPSMHWQSRHTQARTVCWQLIGQRLLVTCPN